MSAISQKSISGITSITTPAGVDNVFTVHTNDTTERFRVDSNGNQVIAGILTASNHVFVTGGDLVINDVISHSGDGNTKIRFPADDTISYETAGSERLRIDSAGRVIIANGGNGGTADVNADNFVVKNTASNTSCGISILNADNQNSTLYFGNASDSKHAEIVWSDASNLFLIGTSNAGASIKFRTANQSDAVFINSSGKVGIGTDNPSQALDVNGKIKVFGSDGSVYGLVISPDSSGGTYEHLIAKMNGDLRIQAGSGTYQASNANILFKNSTKHIIINAGNNGNVGINTNNPGTKLNVVGTIQAYDSATGFVSITPTGSIELRRGNGGFIDFSTAASEDYDCRIKQTGDDLMFETGGAGSASEKLRIASTGNVSIGTQNVTEGKLQVSGDITAGYHHGGGMYGMLAKRKFQGGNALGGYAIRYGSGYESPWIVGYNAGASYDNQITFGSMTTSDRSLETGVTKRMVIDMETGRVGINTSSPSRLLEINTTGTSTEGIVIKSNDNTYPKLDFGANRTNADAFLGMITANWNGTYVADILFESGSDTTNKDNGLISFRTAESGGTRQERLRIDSSGNVIVNDNDAEGNVHPDTKLHVKGGITFRELTSASETALPAITQWSSTGTGQDLAIGARSNNGAVIFFTGNAGTDGDWGNNSNAEKLRITSDGELQLNGNTNKLVLPMYRGTFYCDANSYTKFATVTGNQLSSEIELTCHTTINAIVCTSSFIIKAGHYQDFWVESRELKYSSLTIKCISNNNQNFDIYAKGNGGAGPSTQRAVSFVIIPKNDETVTINNTVNYTGQSIVHSTQTGALKITGTGGVNCDINVAGSITGSSKNFSIEHPLTSLASTKKLVHASIEGPQCDLIYRGKIDLVGGTATVNIDIATGMSDGTFVKLNRDVQCFTTNETGWSAIKGSVSGNILTITAQDNSSTDTISWMVVGERQDDTIKSSSVTDDSGKLIVEPLTNEAPDNSHLHEFYPTS